MMSRPLDVVKRHPLITFFVLTFILSWWTWPLYAMGLSPSPVFSGPLLAALIVIPITQGWAGLRELGSRIIRWRVGWRWYAVALGIPLAVAVAGVALSVALGASWSVAKLPALSALVMVLAIRLLDPLGAPVGEEPGWRGFALPGLQAGRSPLLATAILGVLVTVWHIPLVFAAGEVYLPPISLLATFAVTFFYTWLFNHTGGSVLMTMLAHAGQGVFGLYLAGGFVGGTVPQTTAWLVCVVWCAVAIGLVVFDWKAWRGPAGARATTPTVEPPREATPVAP
jgi:membrane protease YdiL (CAAX protease family)